MSLEHDLLVLREHWRNTDQLQVDETVGGYIDSLQRRLALAEKVCRLADALASEFEAAVESTQPKTGMQVQPCGDFISAARLPIVLSRMRWWAREIRLAQAARAEWEKEKERG